MTTFHNRRVITLGSALIFAVAVSVAFGLSGGAANAAAPPQCDGVGNGGEQGIECTVQVVNNLDNTDPAAPVASSTVTVTTCLGAANAALAGACTTSGPITSPALTTSVDQCNYAVSGGGSTLICTVTVVNNIIGTGTAVPVTINQCNASLDTGDVLACNPYPSTTNPATASIIECNGSDNGGGSVLDCVVDPSSTTSAELPVTVNQCNNSANGGGSSVICRVSMFTNFTAPAVVTPPVSAQGSTGGTTVGTTGSTTTTPVTGTGHTATRPSTGNLAYTGTNPAPLITTGILAILLGGGLTVFAVRRRNAVAQ